MSELALFKGGNVPALLSGLLADNDAYTANVGGGGFPVMSIKGKVFTLVRDGDRNVLTNPNDADEPATSINVVILKTNPGLSKVWYAKAYVEGSDAKPDCFSHNGEVPDPSVEKPQAAKCAICPKNAWGSKMSDDGKKLKACSDSRRIAIANPDALDDPIMLRVPAASLKPLADYAKDLAARKYPVAAVITKIGFDREVASPKLTFKAVAGMPEATHGAIIDAVNSDKVSEILGTAGAAVVLPDEAPADTPQEKVAEKPAEKPKAAKAKPAAEPAPEPKAEEPKPAAKPKVVESDSMEDDLDALLSSLDKE